jgi:hypothetical protein
MYKLTAPPDSKSAPEPAPGKKIEKRRPTFVAASQVPSLQLREQMLTYPGEQAIDLIELPLARLGGYRPVALVWHGAKGSWREPWPE